MNKNLFDFNTGSKYARDCIIAEIIGLQNEIMDKAESEEYKAYQNVLELIIDRHGDMYTEFKG